MRFIVVCIQSILFTFTKAYTINIPCAGCSYLLTSNQGVVQGTGPATHQIEDWQQAHVSTQNTLTEYKNIPEYNVPNDACTKYGGLSILGYCGGYSVIMVTLFVLWLGAFSYATFNIYNRKRL